MPIWGSMPAVTGVYRDELKELGSAARKPRAGCSSICPKFVEMAAVKQTAARLAQALYKIFDLYSLEPTMALNCTTKKFVQLIH